MKRLSLFVIITFVVSASAFLCVPGAALAEEPILVIDSGGHMGMIRDLIFTQDGRYLVSASHDKTVRVWDVTTGETVRVLRGQSGVGAEGTIYAAALSPDDRLLAVGGWLTGTEEEKWAIRLIDFHTGEIMALLKGHENVLGLAFSQDGTKLISGSFDTMARIWDVQTGKTLYVLKGHTESISTVTFSPDGKRAVTGSFDHTLKLWNVKNGALITTLTGHKDRVRAAVFTPDGRYLVSGSDDHTIRLWEVKSGKFLKVLTTLNSLVLSLSISPDGTKVLAGTLESPNSVFSIPSGDPITTFTKPDIVFATAISPDGTIATTAGGNDHEIYLWDINTGRVKQRMVGKGRYIFSVGFAKDGKTIAWGMNSLEQAFQLKGEDGTFNLALNMELQDDSRYLQEIESVGPWSLRTKTDIKPMLQILKDDNVVHEIPQTSTPLSLTLTPDGKSVISGGWGTITFYDLQTGNKLQDFEGHMDAVFGLVVSSDSRFLLSGAWDQTVKLWDITTGKLLLTIFHGSDNEWVAWIPEGYYTCSVKGDRHIGWHVNQGVDKAALYYPASKFAKQFYSPEVVAAYLETGGDLEEAIRLVNEDKQGRQKIEETPISDILKLMPPVTFFQHPDERDVTVTENQIVIKAGAKAVNQEPITDIWVLVNGKRTRGLSIVKENQEQSAQKTLDGLRAAIEQTIPLTQAENKISVIAANQHTQSEPETIVVRQEQIDEGSIEEHSKSSLYVLAIGVSEYQDAMYNLDVAHKDAEAVAELFRPQEGALYKDVNIRLLTNQDATQDAILDGLDWLLRESTQHDLSLLFVAGHGLKDERGNYYFLPHDGDTEKLRRTGVLWYNFQDVLTGLPSKVVFLVDTCHSGSITGTRRGANDLTDALRELIHAESGVVVMTAATGQEYSLEKAEWGHGAFTKAILEGLEGQANYNNDNTIDIKELDLYITNRVKELTDGSQHPTTEIPKTMPNFPMVYR